MTGPSIRSEREDDAAAIHALTAAAFLNAPHTDHTEQFVVRELRAAGKLAISLVAEMDGRIVGHVAISPVSISSGVSNWYGLGPISVEPLQQRKGIGSLLMRRALMELRGIGAAGCVLLGNPKYYSRFGFRPESSLVLQGAPPEYFQAIVMTGAVPAGTVTYHQAFNATS